MVEHHFKAFVLFVIEFSFCFLLCFVFINISVQILEFFKKMKKKLFANISRRRSFFVRFGSKCVNKRIYFC